MQFMSSMELATICSITVVTFFSALLVMICARKGTGTFVYSYGSFISPVELSCKCVCWPPLPSPRLL